MNASALYLSPAEAASRLGISAKALRLYEERGLLEPTRNASGWRFYGEEQMQRARWIASLRSLGLSLAQVSKVLDGNREALATALGDHQVRLEAEVRRIAEAIDKVRGLRNGLSGGQLPVDAAVAEVIGAEPAVAFDLPWPWAGERFEMMSLPALTYIVGPLGSGKTRLALKLAETIPGARFLGLDRLEDEPQAATERLARDESLRARIGSVCARLEDDGATPSPALTALLVALLGSDHAAIVVDLVEEGLDQATQEAVIDWLRCRGNDDAPKLLMMTRSSAFLDLDAVGVEEMILFCPANHSPPIEVKPYPGAPGYEALASCLATPEVRARTAGMTAVIPMPTGAGTS